MLTSIIQFHSSTFQGGKRRKRHHARIVDKDIYSAELCLSEVYECQHIFQARDVEGAEPDRAACLFRFPAPAFPVGRCGARRGQRGSRSRRGRAPCPRRYRLTRL